MRNGLLALVLAGFAALAQARVELPGVLRSAVPELQLLGSGKMTWYGLHVYDAALWTPSADAGMQPSPDLNKPFALALRYSRDFKGERIAQRSLDEIERLGLGTPPQRQQWLAQMRRLFPDVRAGDKLTGLNQPGEGVEFFHQDRRLGSIDDPSFARAFFAIWLDPRTRAPRLREQLIGIR
jgi:hypothetical protein